MKKFFLFSIMLLLASSCSSLTFSESIDGKICNGRYYDSTGSFSVSNEDSPLKNYIEEESNETISCVMFRNDFGELIKIEVQKIPPEMIQIFDELQLDALSNMESLKNIFNNCIFAHINGICPNTTIKSQNELNIEGVGFAYFAILEIPGGSTLVNRETGKRINSTRGYLLSYAQNQLVILSYQESGIANHVRERADQHERLDAMILTKLIEIRKDYKNESI